MSSGDIHAERPYATFYKYYTSIFTVAKKEFYRVYVWLYQGDSQYVGDCLRASPRGSKEKEALKNKDNPISFDIPFLYHLLQHVCGLAEDKSNIWNKPAEREKDSLEHTLYRIKELRNHICHRPDTLVHLTKDELDIKLNEVKDLCRQMIQKAGEKAHRTPDQVDTCIRQLEENLKEIENNPEPSGLDANKFALIGRQEMITHHLSLSPSHSSFVMPLIHSKGETGRHEMSLKFLPLWRCDDGSLPKVIVLQGDTGTGKTSICKYLHNSWLSSDGDIHELQDFDIVLHVPCCEVSTRDLVEFLRGFLVQTIKLCNREEIPDFLKNLRILWLVDGYEEATMEALQLLTKILEQGNGSHQVFITTKPPHCQELLQRYNIEQRLCQVSLSGLNDEGVKTFLMQIFQEENNDSDNCQIKLRDFLSTVVSLGEGPTTDMRVPLKLKLMVELWKSKKLEHSSIASMTHLYEAILEDHVDKLTRKMEKETKHSIQEIKWRIQEWTKVLCKVAFDMTMSGRYVKIDARNQEKLRREAKNLNYPDDCLALFLNPDENRNHGETTSYRFFHGSHQTYLSARHILTLLFNKKDPKKILKRHFREPINHHLYPLLVQVLSNIPKHPSLEESVAGLLVKLISRCREFDPFQVVKDADYSPKVVEEVSKYVERDWYVTHLNMKAAHKMLKYITPTEIDFNIRDSFTEEKEACELMKLVSLKELNLELGILSNKRNIDTMNISSGRLLTSIYSPNAKCHLTHFRGIIKENEARFIKHMIKVIHLDLLVMSNDMLDKIFDNLKYVCNLQFLRLCFFKMPVIMATRSVELPDRCKLSVILQGTGELHIRETGRSLSKISKSYYRITLNDMSATAASELLEELERENVRVQEYHRGISFGDGFFFIHYGSLLLTQPMSLFKEKWEETYVESYEDDLGIRQQRLVVHKSISSKDIKYLNMSPDLRLRIQTF